MKDVKIISFGKIAEITGRTPDGLRAATTDELQALLWQRFPELSTMKYKIAVNQQLISGNVPLPDNAEIALLPPFSGG